MMCSPCLAGEGPNSASTSCIGCSGAQYSTTGVCQPCGFGEAPSADHTFCSQVSAGSSLSDEVVVKDLLRSSARLANERNDTATPAIVLVTLRAQVDPRIFIDETARATFASKTGQAMADCLLIDSLSAGSPLTIRNVARATPASLPARRMLTEPGNMTSEARFDVEFGFDHLTTMDRLHEQLANASSPLMSHPSMKINASTVPIYALTCSAGLFMDAQSVCVSCPVGRFSQDGQPCERCEDVSMVPNKAGDRCECDSDYYDLAHGAILCFTSGYLDDWIELDEYAGVKAARLSGWACAPLPKHVPCVNKTANGTLLILPGFGLSGHTQASYPGLGVGTRTETALFACPAGATNCVGEAETGGGTCAEGSAGPVCAICEAGWVGGTNDGCSMCGDEEQRRALQEKSALGDGVKIAIVVCLILLAVAVLIPLLRAYRKQLAPMLQKLLKYKKFLAAAKVKRPTNPIGSFQKSGSGDRWPSRQKPPRWASTEMRMPASTVVVTAAVWTRHLTESRSCCQGLRYSCPT